MPRECSRRPTEWPAPPAMPSAFTRCLTSFTPVPPTRAGGSAILLCAGKNSLSLLAVIFILAGLYIGTEEALEDSLTAEIVPKELHGMAFGTLAAVNAVGDFLSSLLVGFLWSAFNVQTAFFASAILFIIGAILILRLR